MRRAKYIMLFFQNLETPIIFPMWMNHREVAVGLTGNDLSKVMSAGFVYLEAAQVTCFGRSESLNLSAKSGDEDFVARALGLQKAKD